MDYDNTRPVYVHEADRVNNFLEIAYITLDKPEQPQYDSIVAQWKAKGIDAVIFSEKD